MIKCKWICNYTHACNLVCCLAYLNQIVVLFIYLYLIFEDKFSSISQIRIDRILKNLCFPEIV